LKIILVRKMNKEIVKQIGFERQVKSVKKRKCPLCRKEFDPEKEFRDHSSFQEYLISELCQECQDEVFGK